MNERDSLQVAEMLQNRGFLMTSDQAEADVILINTCSVRDQAEQKALNKMTSVQHLGKLVHILFMVLWGAWLKAEEKSFWSEAQI